MFDFLLALCLGTFQKMVGCAFYEGVEDRDIVQIHQEQVDDFAMTGVISTHFGEGLLGFQDHVQEIDGLKPMIDNLENVSFLEVIVFGKHVTVKIEAKFE